MQRLLINSMPRKAQTKERFKSISIEESLFQELHDRRLINEPIYKTARRLFHINTEGENSDVQFMLEEYRRASTAWKDKYLNMVQTIDPFIKK